MSKRNRPSVLKRQREIEKRQRQARKAAKAAEKRDRRLNKGNGESEFGEDAEAPDGDETEADNPPPTGGPID